MTTNTRARIFAYGMALALCVQAVHACAAAKSIARTAIDIAREACDVFLSQQPEPERLLGMDLDTCAEQLLSAQRQTLAARKQAP